MKIPNVIPDELTDEFLNEYEEWVDAQVEEYLKADAMIDELMSGLTDEEKENVTNGLRPDGSPGYRFGSDDAMLGGLTWETNGRSER